MSEHVITEERQVVPVVKKEKESHQLNELYGALSKAQSEMEVSKPTRVNPFYKSRYSDLASIVKSSRSCLSKNGLAVIQRISTNSSGRMFLCTRLCHSSGQWIESDMPINPPKGDIQSIGSYITYIKRYTYAAIVGVVSSEEDDDAEMAMKNVREQEEQKPQNLNINKAQLKELIDVLDGDPILTANEILKGYKINKLADLPMNKFHSCIAGIKQRKEKK